MPLRLQRKEEIYKLLKENRIIAYPPDYLYVDYQLMIAIFCRHPANEEVAYPLPDSDGGVFAGTIKFW
jgi:hypothetical protein